MGEMRQKELEMKQNDHLLAKQEAEQDFKMKTYEHIQKLKSPPYNWSNDKIKRFLGPNCEPILEVVSSQRGALVKNSNGNKKHRGAWDSCWDEAHMDSMMEMRQKELEMNREMRQKELEMNREMRQKEIDV